MKHTVVHRLPFRAAKAAFWEVLTTPSHAVCDFRVETIAAAHAANVPIDLSMQTAIASTASLQLQCWNVPVWALPDCLRGVGAEMMKRFVRSEWQWGSSVRPRPPALLTPTILKMHLSAACCRFAVREVQVCKWAKALYIIQRTLTRWNTTTPINRDFVLTEKNEKRQATLLLIPRNTMASSSSLKKDSA